MTDQRWEQAKVIFEEATRRRGGERDAFVEGACGDDVGLRRDVETLLRGHDEAGSFLEDPTAETDATIFAPVREEPGTMIGNYKLLQRIGEGGFGVVFMADQTRPVRRRVALKIIKLGMDTKQVVARFTAERQALAMMDHPNIAKVYDGGATETGRPYFVMELVRGDPITEYCDRHNLDTRGRLDIFQQVCRAIQHAHQRGIIHRDLKPTNVLVTVADGRPIPKVIDFGIAKATSASLTEHTVFTEFRQLIGTPEYMSPEQAEVSGVDVDTRTDIYALGVLLYELLTGTTPFDARALRSAAFGEIQRIIREVEPERPSTRLSSMIGGEAKSAQEIAKQRHTDPQALARSLRGDLDWIVMKCLDKNRTRRYDTANCLLHDIQHYLADEPVTAGPPSATYRLRKLIRRRRGPMAAAAAIAILLVGGIVGTTTAMTRARHAERVAREQAEAAQAAQIEAEEARTEAEANERLAAEKAAEARRQQEIAEAVNAFLNDDLLAAVAPSAEAGRGRDVAMRDVLDEAARRIDDAARSGGRFADKPLVEASIRTILARTYFQLGELAPATPHAERALELQQSHLGDTHGDTLTSLNLLAVLTVQQGRRDEAAPLFEQVLAVHREVYGDEHPRTLASMNNLANLHRARGDLAGAAELHAEALEIQRRVIGEDDTDTLTSMMNLGITYIDLDRTAEAATLLTATLEARRRVLSPKHPDTLWTAFALAAAVRAESRYDEAERLYREAYEGLAELMGPTHRLTSQARRGLIDLYTLQGRDDDATPLLIEHLDLLRAAADTPDATSTALNLAAWTLLTHDRVGLRDPAAALGYARRAADLTNHAEYAILDTLALALYESGDAAGAVAMQRRALDAAPAGSNDRAQMQASLDRYEAAVSPASP